MRKIIFLFLFHLIVLSLASILFSQDTGKEKEQPFQKTKKIQPDSCNTVLKSRTVDFEKDEFYLSLPRGKKSKRVYLKMREPVSKTIKNRLAQNGINIKEYVGDKTYIIELNENKLDILKNTNYIIGFSEIDYSDKLSEKLYKGNFSNYAKDGNCVKVVVKFYEDVSYDEAIIFSRSMGSVIESKSFSITHKLILSIHQINIKSLAESDNVKYVDEISPPVTENNIDAGRLSNVFWDNESGALSGLYDYPYYIKGNSVMFYNYLLSCML